MAEVARVDDSGLAYAIPIYQRFHVRSYPIVGTTLDYLAYRHLEIATGRSLAVLGECVLGATVATELGLRPGDTLVSRPENLFDLEVPSDLAAFVKELSSTTRTKAFMA